MAIDVVTETIIPIRHVPDWCEEHLGQRVHPSTVNRWRLRGVRGARLETLLTGGTRSTSEQALSRFFAATTAAADGQSPNLSLPSPHSEDAILEAEAFLDDQS